MKKLDIFGKECQKAILKIMSEDISKNPHKQENIVYSKDIKPSKFTYKSKVINQTLLEI